MASQYKYTDILQENLDTHKAQQASERTYEVLYRRVLVFLYFHLAGLYGLYLCFTTAKWATMLFAWVIFMATMTGITAGAHRLWTHRAYKAKMPLQVLLMVFTTFGCQYTVFNWVREHRMHHKYSDTDADPHNARRGFFFSHIGWLLVKKHPEIKLKGKTIDMSDIYANPVLKFQDKYGLLFVPIVGIFLPTLIPVYFWNEDLLTAWYITFLRFVLVLHLTFLVNSAAHMWGTKPFNKHIKPVNNTFVYWTALGEGYHNYHHAFPWDYRLAELGHSTPNFTKKFIDFFAWVGWAYDLKTASEEVVKSTMERLGDGSGPWSNVKMHHE